MSDYPETIGDGDTYEVHGDIDFRNAPDIEDLEEMMADGGCEATDGCWVEPDGTCEHGCRSWLLELGMI